MAHQWTVTLDGKEPTILDADDLTEASNLAAKLAPGKPFSVSRIEPPDVHLESAVAKLVELGLSVKEAGATTGKGG